MPVLIKEGPKIKRSFNRKKQAAYPIRVVTRHISVYSKM